MFRDFTGLSCGPLFSPRILKIIRNADISILTRTSLKRNATKNENVVEAKTIGNKSAIECEEFSVLYNATQTSVDLKSTSLLPSSFSHLAAYKETAHKGQLIFWSQNKTQRQMQVTPEGVAKRMSSCKQNRLPRKNKLQRKPWLSPRSYSLMSKSFNASVCGASLSCGVQSIPYCMSCAGSEPLDWHFEGISIKDFWLIPSDLRLESR